MWVLHSEPLPVSIVNNKHFVVSREVVHTLKWTVMWNMQFAIKRFCSEEKGQAADLLWERFTTNRKAQILSHMKHNPHDKFISDIFHINYGT